MLANTPVINLLFRETVLKRWHLPHIGRFDTYQGKDEMDSLLLALITVDIYYYLTENSSCTRHKKTNWGNLYFRTFSEDFTLIYFITTFHLLFKPLDYISALNIKVIIITSLALMWRTIHKIYWENIEITKKKKNLLLFMLFWSEKKKGSFKNISNTRCYILRSTNTRAMEEK